jgi:hypothetical protein
MKLFNNLKDARSAALKKSKANPKRYIMLIACFGLEVVSYKRLHVFAPSDSYGNSYWLNGKEKFFSECQKAADSQASPVLS